MLTNPRDACLTQMGHTGWLKNGASVFHCKYFENPTTDFHNSFASKKPKYCQYLFAYLLIIVSFNDVTLDVIFLFIFVKHAGPVFFWATLYIRLPKYRALETWIRVTQDHRKCYHSIERTRLPIHVNYGCISCRFWDRLCDFEKYADLEIRVRGQSKSLTRHDIKP